MQFTEQEKIAAFKKREQPAAMRKGALGARTDVVPAFLNGRQLRDYQRESLQWMMANFRIQKNCILGDEMVRGLCLPACFPHIPSLPKSRCPWTSREKNVFLMKKSCTLCLPISLLHLIYFAKSVHASANLFNCTIGTRSC